MVEVWASMTDALLQEFLEKCTTGDRLGSALISVKLAQLGYMLMNYFKEVGESFIDGETELKAARQAVKQLDLAVRRAMESAGMGKTLSEADEDPSLN